MKISTKFLFIAIILSCSVFSGTTFAQSQLPTVVVTGVRPTNWSCTGQCVDQFFARYNYADSNILSESAAPLGAEDPGEPVLETAKRIPGVLQCAGQQHTRDSQAWVMYRAFAATKGTVGGMVWDSKQRNGFFSFMFSDGSIGIYQRTDSQYLDSDGMVEIKKPSCGG